MFFHFSFKAIYLFYLPDIFLGDDSRTQKLDTKFGGDRSRMWKVEEADHAEIGECNIFVSIF